MSCTNYNISGVSPPITITPLAVNFTISKTSDKCIFTSNNASELITYTVKVTNNTTSTVSYQLTDILTSGANPLGVPLTLTTVSGPAIQLVILSLTPPLLGVQAITLTAGQTWTGSAQYQPLFGDLGHVIKNTFTAQAGTITNVIVLPPPLNLLFTPLLGQSSTVTNTIDYAHLTLTETYTPSVVAIGTTIVYSYILQNDSTIPVNNIVITDNSNPGPAKFLPSETSNIFTMTPSYTLAPGAATAPGDIPNATYLITSNTPITATATATAITVCTSGQCIVTGTLAGAPYVPQQVRTESKATPATSSSAALSQVTIPTTTKNNALITAMSVSKNNNNNNGSNNNNCVSSTVSAESDKKIIHPTQAVQPINKNTINCTNPKRHAPHQRCVHCK